MLKFLRDNALNVVIIVVVLFILSLVIIGWQSSVTESQNSPASNQKMTEGVFASYDGKEIDYRRYMNILQQNSAAIQDDLADPFLVMYLQYRTLQDTMNFEAYLSAAKKYKIKAKRSEIKYSLDKIKENYNLGSNRELKVLLQKNNYDLKKLKNDLSDDIIIKKYLKMISDLSQVTEIELKDQYKQVKASHILIAVNDANKRQQEELAQQVYEKTTNQDFAELAKQYSNDPGSADKGGDLGWFGKGMMVPQFEEVAFSLNPGDISKPFLTDFGFHIVKVLDIKEGEIPLDVDVEQLKKAYQQQKEQELVMKDVGDVSKKIKIYDRAMLAYDAKLKGEWPLAYNYYSLLLSDNSNNPVYHLFLADVLDRQGETKKAEKEYEKAILKGSLMNKKDPFTYLYYGKFLSKQKDNKKAAAQFTQVEQIASQSVSVLKALEKSYKDIGYTKSAARVAKKYERIELERELQKAELQKQVTSNQTQQEEAVSLDIK